MAERLWIHFVKLTGPYTTTSVNPAASPPRFRVRFLSSTLTVDITVKWLPEAKTPPHSWRIQLSTQCSLTLTC